MEEQNGPSFCRSIRQTRHIYKFASPRCKLRDGAMCPPPQQSDRNGRAPDFEAQTEKSAYTVVLRPKPPKSSISAWASRDLSDDDACPALATLDTFESFARARRMSRLLTPPSSLLTQPNAVASFPLASLLIHALCGPSVTPPSFFGSLSPSLLAFIPEPFTWPSPRTIDCHVTLCICTSQSRQVWTRNGCQSLIITWSDHHWSSRSIEAAGQNLGIAPSDTRRKISSCLSIF